MAADKRSMDEIEGDIRAARARLGRTVDALERKAAPVQLLTRGIEMVRSNTSAPTHRLGEAMSRNPVPVALIGAGIGWLIWSSIRGETRVQKAKRRLGEIAEAGAEELHDGSSVAEIAAEAAATAAPAPVRSVESLLARHPLALGGMAALAGALVAAFLPSTRREDALLGPARDTLRERALDEGEDALSRIEELARDAAAAAVGAAFDTVRDEFAPAEASTAEAPANPIPTDPVDVHPA